jgi:hypothetical protein
MAEQVIFKSTRVERKLYRMEKKEGVGQYGPWVTHTSVEAGREEVIFETSIDLGMLEDMGRKAAGNRSQKCRDGALTVRVLSRRRLA